MDIFILYMLRRQKCKNSRQQSQNYRAVSESHLSNLQIKQL